MFWFFVSAREVATSDFGTNRIRRVKSASFLSESSGGGVSGFFFIGVFPSDRVLASVGSDRCFGFIGGQCLVGDALAHDGPNRLSEA
jgi:hypothetical protein